METNKYIREGECEVCRSSFHNRIKKLEDDFKAFYSKLSEKVPFKVFMWLVGILVLILISNISYTYSVDKSQGEYEKEVIKVMVTKDDFKEVKREIAEIKQMLIEIKDVREQNHR